MAQAAAPEGPGLPCSPKHALALYQLLFRRPAGLGQLQAAVRQVHEGPACLPGLELPMVLLEMERRQRARKKLLWDLELLTGLGLGLFWPPCTRVYGQRDPTQHTRSWYSRDSEQLNSRLRSPPKAGHTPSQNYQSLERGETRDSSASELRETRSDADPRQENPSIPPGAAPGCLQELDLTTTVSNFKESGNSELKGEERSQAEPSIQRPEGPTSRSPQGRKLTQEAPQTSGLAPHGLPTPQDPCKSLGSGMGTETQALLASLPGHPRDSRRSPGAQIPQAGEPGRPTGPTRELAAVLEPGAAGKSPSSDPVPGPRMRGVRSPGASGPPELPAALPGRSPSPTGQELKAARAPGALGQRRLSAPGSPKAAWPAPGSAGEAPRDAALQRLLELHGAARRRRRRDRERQRLRVLERLHIAGNRHRRVHPLGLPLELPSQEDAAGRRHALRERLQQVHLQRTRRLRALVARNTQDFQELLSPGAEEPVLGD